jgi:Na+/alanine symporter
MAMQCYVLTITSEGRLITLNALNELLNKQKEFISMMLYPLAYTSMINFRIYYEEATCVSTYT